MDGMFIPHSSDVHVNIACFGMFTAHLDEAEHAAQSCGTRC